MASLVRYNPNDAIPPANAVELGSQTDSGRMWTVIANTPYGKLPGNNIDTLSLHSLQAKYSSKYCSKFIIYFIICR